MHWLRLFWFSPCFQISFLKHIRNCRGIWLKKSKNFLSSFLVFLASKAMVSDEPIVAPACGSIKLQLGFSSLIDWFTDVNFNSNQTIKPCNIQLKVPSRNALTAIVLVFSLLPNFFFKTYQKLSGYLTEKIEGFSVLFSCILGFESDGKRRTEWACWSAWRWEEKWRRICHRRKVFSFALISNGFSCLFLFFVWPREEGIVEEPATDDSANALESGELVEPATKKAKLDVVVPENYVRRVNFAELNFRHGTQEVFLFCSVIQEEEEDDFEEDWKGEGDDDEDEGFVVAIDQPTAPRYNFIGVIFFFTSNVAVSFLGSISGKVRRLHWG